MREILTGFVLPVLLLAAAGLNWSLFSLFDLLIFLALLFHGPKIGFNTWRWPLLLLCIFTFSLLSIISHILFHIILIFQGDNWKLMDSRWAQLLGVHSWRVPSVIYFMVIQFLLASIAVSGICGSACGFSCCQHSWFQCFCSSIEYIGAHLRALCCILLPIVEIVVGISHPSWTSLPFFLCSCVGLVDWSLTSNFLGLFRWWRFLLLYSAFSIILLSVYQLPIKFSDVFVHIAELIGLYKICGTSEWSEICSSASLLVFYIMLAVARRDLTEMDFIMSTRESNLREELLPLKHSFFVHQSRSGVRHANILLRGAVFQTFIINFFTYGFPISLLALSFWSFHFASLCAFGLLAYVGYILYALPSMLNLHRLNGLLLIFILLWAASTYIFNVAFADMNKKFRKDVKIWETVGLWHYQIPGFYLLAQFCLGILVAVVNLVNNSVFLYMSGGDRASTFNDHVVEDGEDMKVMFVATIAWGLRKSSRAIVLLLIFPIATKPGFIHAAYILFFMMYLMNHSISRKLRQSLLLLCEAHFALLYILHLDLICRPLEKAGSLANQVLSGLGLLHGANSGDILEIVVLACFCAIHNHGFEILFSFSAILQHAPSPPVGFSILKAGLTKSVLLSVYTSKSRENQFTNLSREGKIAAYLNKVGERFLLAYRSCGTYIAFLTILLTVYSVSPNYASFGYLFFLLLWMMGRQLMGKTERPLWLPLKLYSVVVFLLIYFLSVFNLNRWFSTVVDLYSAFGFKKDASVLKNIAEPLAILVVMQLYSYERRQSKYISSNDHAEVTHGDFSFGKRLLILHSEKILSVTLLYASLSSISLFGCVYILGLVISATFPKTSRLPSKFFLIYSGIHLMIGYLFQMWGCQNDMVLGKKNSYISLIFGLHVFNPGFFGLESGLRADVLVIVACIVQYNVFFWVGRLPDKLRHKGKWEEPCFLFSAREESVNQILHPRNGSQACILTNPLLEQKDVTNHQLPVSNFEKPQSSDILPPDAGNLVNDNTGKYIPNYMQGKDDFRRNKRRIVLLRKERLEMQKFALKTYMKFWVENFFNLYGLEINMIALLLASFDVLNAISLFYIALLAACILLQRNVLRRLWPVFVFLFAAVLNLEYLAVLMNVMSLEAQSTKEDKMPCHDCWRSSKIYFDFCLKCWLGIIVDDPRLLISYYVVFMLSCFKLRSDRLSNVSGLRSYVEMLSFSENILIDFSFKMKGMWTFLDYLKLYGYCHLLDLVLALILVTGTLEYDVLHLGYLGFALVFFRMRHRILRKGNEIFKLLRMYNFALVILSLAYQSPFIDDMNDGKCGLVGYMCEMLGFYKYDYSFRITSRSAFVEIVIYMLVALQSYMFSSKEFANISKYLEAEQIDSIIREQEKRAAWKTSQLQHVRKSEEEKRLRNLQVEKMKLEMLNLQVQLHSLSSSCESPGARNDGLRRRKNACICGYSGNKALHGELSRSAIASSKGVAQTCLDENSRLDFTKSSSSFVHKAKDLIGHPHSGPVRLEQKQGGTFNGKENPLKSAVSLIGDGVSQVQSLGNFAVDNLVSLLKIESEELDAAEHSPQDMNYNEMKGENVGIQAVEQPCSSLPDHDKGMHDSSCSRIRIIFNYLWVQMQSNNDIVCYCCFVLIFLWSFSLLSIVYLMAVFLYALCINTGPTYMFWVIMLIYTEVCILVLYIYQIIIQHCSFSIDWSFLNGLGFPAHKIMSSFVLSNWPLFLVYLFTLLQSSITAKDGEWASLDHFSSSREKNHYHEQADVGNRRAKKLWHALFLLKSTYNVFIRSLYRYWKSLRLGAETPPYFVQLSVEVNSWPEDGIQPEGFESGINRLLEIVQDGKRKKSMNSLHLASKIHVQSIERSSEIPTVAIAVLEVLYASPPAVLSDVECYQSLSPAADVADEILNAQNDGLFDLIGFPYQVLSAIGGGRREIDLYAYTFCADLLVFFLVAIFYESVIKNKSEFLEVYQLEDQFPKEFVFILMIIFFLIVLDRIMYLCSFATGKVIFYLFNLSLFTYSVTKYAWYMEPSHQHAGRLALRAIYLTKSISLALRAVQMRYGIPPKSTLYRQFLTSSICHVNFSGFRVYRALPFLHELRSVLDWSCTTTSLTMYDWLKLEDIHASLFLVKCDADLNRATHQQGQKQTRMTKFCNGICLFLVLICVIWAPMLMYSSGNPTNIANPIKDASVRIDIKSFSGRLTLYETTLCKQTLWNEIENEANVHADLDPEGYLSFYNEQDIQLICCQADASTLWQVPSAVLAQFTKSLDLNMDIIFSWQFNRDRPKGKEVVKYDLTMQASDMPKMSQVMEVLNGTRSSFGIYNIYPKYFRVTGSGDVRFLEQEVDLVSGDLVLNRGNPAWWSFHDYDASNSSGCEEFGGPNAIVVSEETPQGILGETLSKFSIWGLYITFVLAVGRFIRFQCSDLRMRIPYENLPSCDRLLAICEDIYAARAEGELEVEEVLYWTLVKIYRSPHMLLQYTKSE